MKLISTLGTSPGGIYETYVNLAKGNYEGEEGQPIEISEIYVIRTKDPDVEFAWELLKAIFVCCGTPKKVEIADIPLDINDVDSRSSFQLFNNAVKEKINVGDYVDITGGRKSMSVAAALAAVTMKAHVVNSIIPQKETNRIQDMVKRLKDKKEIIGTIGNRGKNADTEKQCKDLGICDLVSSLARTILLI